MEGSPACPELWNETRPRDILKLHQDAVDAGSDLFLTNSFGGNSARLKLHNAGHRARDAVAIGRLIDAVVASVSDPVAAADGRVVAVLLEVARESRRRLRRGSSVDRPWGSEQRDNRIDAAARTGMVRGARQVLQLSQWTG